MPLDYRNNDAALTICQNNAAKTITISNINQNASELIGFTANELIGTPLKRILPARIGELLEEYVEFETDTNDVGAVLSRVQSFSIIEKDGKEKAYKIKLSQSESSAGNLFFTLVLRDALGLRKNEAVRNVIQENFKGHESLDSLTGLPDKSSLIKDIDLMKSYSNAGDIDSCFAILQIDSYDILLTKYGAEICNNILKHVSFIARQSLRPDDVLARISNDQLGILLVDLALSSARIVFNRLRWQVAANPYTLPQESVLGETSIGLSTSISFCKISGTGGGSDIIKIVEKSLDDLAITSANMLIEVKVA